MHTSLKSTLHFYGLPIPLTVKMAAVMGVMLPCLAGAQIRTDGSVGPAAQTLSGPRFIIPETLGKLSGSNLFHSFQSFNLGSQESANFTTSTTGIANVISRVTGGSLSQINGKLSLTAASGSPNFYFINPAGVTFGAGASIDVPGAFHVSTASYLKFPDGNFHADIKSASTFSSSTPEAFGFLGNSRAAIVVKDRALLATRVDQSLSLAAGDVEINNATVQTTAGGNILVAATGTQAKDIPLTASLPSLDGTLTVANGGAIIANTGPLRNVGNIAVSAGDITIRGQLGNKGLTGITSTAGVGTRGMAGDIVIAAANNLSILNGGSIVSNTLSSGNSGTVKVTAGNITMDGQGAQTRIGAAALEGSTGTAGSVEITASGNVRLINRAIIEAPTLSSGGAGTIKVSAGNLTIDGQGAGISGSALQGSSGNGGSVEVAVGGNLSIERGGFIDSSTFASGDAGTVKVTAGNIALNQKNASTLTGISSSAEPSSRGNAGSVDVTSRGNLTIENGAKIRTTASSSGNAGRVAVNVLGDLSIVNGGVIESPTVAGGNAGFIEVTAGNITINGQGKPTGISGSALRNSGGNAGSVEVTVKNNLSIINTGSISSSTFALGDAGSVKIFAKNISIDGPPIEAQPKIINQPGVVQPVQPVQPLTGIASSAESGSKGNAGSVVVNTLENLSMQNNARISSTAHADGNGGSVEVVSQGNISILNGASIESPTLSKGNAGSLIVTASGNLLLANSGQINSSTLAGGNAGSVKVNAGSIVITGDLGGKSSVISASAAEKSSGQTGSVDVAAKNSIDLSKGGRIEIQNSATVPDPGALSATLLTVRAPTITLNGSQISAASSGNIAASNIGIKFSDRLALVSSNITTSANEGNGGSILIDGGKVLSLDKSQITTSVSSTRNGNAGDISVRSESLVMQTGFIQANTAATNASGGNVVIEVQTLVPSLSTLLLGGSTPLQFSPLVPGYNVIQAAAPTGLIGNIKVSSPTLNIAGSLVQLKYQIIDSGGLGRNLCQVNRGSSLTQSGRGGLPVSSQNLLFPQQPDSTTPAETGKSSPRTNNSYARWNCQNG